MRRIATVAALAVPCLLSLGAAAPALAADDCPNAAVRAQQQSQHLPNCMAYEKVTPHDKGGELAGPTAVMPSGDGAFIMLNAGIEDALSFTAARYRSLRSPDGRWTTNALMPAMDGAWHPKVNDAIGDPQAWTPDFSRVIVSTGYPVHDNDRGLFNPTTQLGTDDVYLREENGEFRWLVPDDSVVDSSALHVALVGASSGLERIVLRTARPWDPRVTAANGQQLYVWTPGGTRLASLLPDGAPASSLTTGKVSDDGRRIAFAASQRVYVRFDAHDPAATTREVAVGPNGETCASAALEYLSADGTKVAFSCQASATPGALPAAWYLRDLDGGPSAVRALPGNPGAIRAFATDDLSIMYGFEGSGPDAKVVRFDADTAKVVARIARWQHSSRSNFQAFRSAMSVDGEYLAFGTSNDLGLPGIDAGRLDQEQVYLYSARTDELTCVSCHQDGRPTEGYAELRGSTDTTGGAGGGATASVDPVSTRGTVTFTTSTALVPEDTNGKPDAYMWVDGRAVLLSGGRSPQFSLAQGTTPDGSSVFLATSEALVADDRDGGAYDLYVARVNGGVLLPDPPPAPCTANCRPPGAGVPGRPRITTGETLLGGNLAEPDALRSGRASASVTVPRSVRGTRTTVRVRVSRPGAIRLSGNGLRRVTRTAKKAGTVRMTVRLSAHGLRQQRKRGQWSTRITARLTPDSGSPVQARKTVRFTAAKKGGR